MALFNPKFFCGFFLSVISCSTLSSPLPKLPEPVANNAVAKVTVDKQDYLLSFMGLAKGKTDNDVHNKAWALAVKADTDWQVVSNSNTAKWQTLPPVPHIEALKGRLASIAIGIKGTAYIFGGYTVAADHTEVSTKDNYKFDIKTQSYQRIADMPVAVDDTTVIKYQDRYIYLFSGWHQSGNVNLVQVYDTQTNTWAQATPLPISATFGLAAGAVDRSLVLCDGVKVAALKNQKRTFESSPKCLYGLIDEQDHLTIHWQAIPHFITPLSATKSTPDIGYYRMAAVGVPDANNAGQIVFIGGSDNPYNYNGIGYNGKPSEPSAWMNRFDLATHQWLVPQKLPQASMDHRGLILYNESLIRIGGMTQNQQVTDKVFVDPVQNLRYK
ncbi:galactose oxidase [Shewanella sp. OPT22]|nr:galactose oxidase [Shewanella sp. OPT22]